MTKSEPFLHPWLDEVCLEPQEKSIGWEKMVAYLGHKPSRLFFTKSSKSATGLKTKLNDPSFHCKTSTGAIAF